jgi:hypothetical protein
MMTSLHEAEGDTYLPQSLFWLHRRVPIGFVECITVISCRLAFIGIVLRNLGPFYVQCVRTVAVHLQKVLEVMSTSVCTGLNPFNFIRRHFLQICVRKVAVHLWKVLEVMSTSVCTGLNQIYLS